MDIEPAFREASKRYAPNGPELHDGLLYCYKGTNITGERVVNRSKTQLNDALVAFGIDLHPYWAKLTYLPGALFPQGPGRMVRLSVCA